MSTIRKFNFENKICAFTFYIATINKVLIDKLA